MKPIVWSAFGPVRALVMALALAASSIAGGPIFVDAAGSGTPYTWQIPIGGPAAAFYNIEAGPLNAAVDNATAIAGINRAFATWQAVPTATITYQQGSPLTDAQGLPLDVDETNVQSALFAFDGQSPIVLDDDGAIFALLGLPPGTLGVAGPEIITVGAPFAIVEGFAIFNGSAVAPLGPFPLAAFEGIFVHELGHFSNLAHSVVNGQAFFFGDQSGPTPNDTFGPPPASSVETMYPFLAPITGVHQATLHADDIATLSLLYPAPGFTGNDTAIAGRILASDGQTGVTGVNVIARNPLDPFNDARSAFSGDFTRGAGPLPNGDGDYRLVDLRSGADYVVYVDQVVAGNFSAPVLFPFSGPEEFYNGVNESRDQAIDSPEDFVAVSVASATSGIDIILNGPPPDPNEPNDTLSEATVIPCPFESVDASIHPFGDVDFYAFNGKERTLVEIDTDALEDSGSLDAMLGLFDEQGDLLAFNDDGPAPGEPFGLDSFVSFVLPATGVYSLGVTSFFDFGFDGGGDAISRGSYRLSVSCLDPIMLNDQVSSGAMETSLVQLEESPGNTIGVFTVAATFTYHGAAAIRAPFFRVSELSGGNRILNGDNAAMGVGATLSAMVGDNGILSPGESFQQTFRIRLEQIAPFTFLVDFLGIPLAN